MQPSVQSWPTPSFQSPSDYVARYIRMNLIRITHMPKVLHTLFLQMCANPLGPGSNGAILEHCCPSVHDVQFDSSDHMQNTLCRLGLGQAACHEDCECRWTIFPSSIQSIDDRDVKALAQCGESFSHTCRDDSVLAVHVAFVFLPSASCGAYRQDYTEQCQYHIL